MGRKSREKHDRMGRPGKPVSWRFWDFRFERSTLLLIVGVLTLGFGLSAMQSSRWDHTHILPVFHPWAIVLGFLIIVYSFKSAKSS